ncbi:MarR family winged helix-turn-helix transcriptional regulator [Streptomyces ipomoeae]|uniref:MarR family winged helix-turn-helix transcriptional regulator n=1 Tax=Streptomyces ipomoeae TaxID=103232 RepID=UPI0011471098|nr:MarR family transcriptional regulator [Streptomyces ipomoeae]MDX2938991.1 MarR family transcriptional regulator [Streptomyces ipomoeae]TQE30021.1 MarR family transcriptional regulator [Streptomyces ipomoeae]
MARQTHYEELARQLSAVGVVKREIARMLPPDCPGGSAGVLTLLGRHGEMRMSRLAELLAVDISVTSRHVAHVADRGWIERLPDPADKRSRILRLTPEGQDKLAELHRRSTRLMAERLSHWSDDEVGQLVHLLDRLRDSFDDCRAGPRTTPRTAPPVPARVPVPVAEAQSDDSGDSDDDGTHATTPRTPA